MSCSLIKFSFKGLHVKNTFALWCGSSNSKIPQDMQITVSTTVLFIQLLLNSWQPKHEITWKQTKSKLLWKQQHISWKILSVGSLICNLNYRHRNTSRSSWWVCFTHPMEVLYSMYSTSRFLWPPQFVLQGNTFFSAIILCPLLFYCLHSWITRPRWYLVQTPAACVLPFVSQTAQSVARKPRSEVWAFMRPYWGVQRHIKGKTGWRGWLNNSLAWLFACISQQFTVNSNKKSTLLI